MEALWVYPWLAWIGKWPALAWQRPPLSLASLILLLSLSLFATRFFLSRRWSLLQVRLSLVACGLIAIFTVVRIEYGAGSGLLDSAWFASTAHLLLDSFSHLHPLVIALGVGLYLWWRGTVWGRSPLYFDDIYHSLLIGLIALVTLILARGADPGMMSAVGLYVIGFFFCGLCALALARLQVIQKQAREKEEAVPAFSGRWIAIIAGITGGIVLEAIGTASIFSADFVALVGRLLNFTADLLLKALEYLLTPLAYLVAGLFYVVQFIVNLFRQGQTPQPFFSENTSGIEGLPEVIPKALPPVAILAIKWGFFSLVIAGVLFLLARAVFRYRSYQSESEAEEINESLWSWEGFKADLRLFFRLLRQRFSRQSKKGTPAIPILSQQKWEEDESRLGIREIYQRLLWQASHLSLARRRHETPSEYAARLGQAVSGGSTQLSELTRLYINVRYGELEAETEQVDSANNLWRAFKKLLVKLKPG